MAEIVSAMRAVSRVPVTVKCRIGVDDMDSYDALHSFVATVSQEGGVLHFVVHARKAVLSGLSPAENRSIPPLRYDVVYQLVRDFPQLRFTLNGGIKSLEEARAHLQRGVSGVMIGREACANPWMLATADQQIFGEPCPTASVTRRSVLLQYRDYLLRLDESLLLRPSVRNPMPALLHSYAPSAPSAGRSDSLLTPSLALVLRPLFALVSGLPGARQFRNSMADAVAKQTAALKGAHRPRGPSPSASEAAAACRAVGMAAARALDHAVEQLSACGSGSYLDFPAHSSHAHTTPQPEGSSSTLRCG